MGNSMTTPEPMTAESVAEAIYQATVKNSGADAKFWFPCLFAEQKIAAYGYQRAVEAININIKPHVIIDDQRAAKAEAEVARLKAALQPFANAIENDNGDVTYHWGMVSSDHLFKAYKSLTAEADHG